MDRTEATALTLCVMFVAAFLCFLCYSVWQNSVNNTNADTVRMTACVAAGKDWVFVDDANSFQCIGGRG